MENTGIHYYLVTKLLYLSYFIAFDKEVDMILTVFLCKKQDDRNDKETFCLVTRKTACSQIISAAFVQIPDSGLVV